MLYLDVEEYIYEGDFLLAIYFKNIDFAIQSYYELEPIYFKQEI